MLIYNYLYVNVDYVYILSLCRQYSIIHSYINNNNVILLKNISDTFRLLYGFKDGEIRSGRTHNLKNGNLQNILVDKYRGIVV